MNKNLIYAFVASCLLAFTACTDSIEDATNKHVYTVDENPYLKVNTDAVVTSSLEFPVGHFTAQKIKLSDYEEKFKTNMGMTVDQVLTGLKNGTVVFYNINTTRGRWNKAAMTKTTTGWYYNTAGGVCDASDKQQIVSLDIDTNDKTLIVNANDTLAAGTQVALNVGFAVNGPDYDKYVRFENKVKVTDPSIIMAEIAIPTGDYSSYALNFNDYADVIQICMGLSVKDFLKSIDSNGERDAHMYMVSKTREWDTTSSYTANAPGYWINDLGAVCNWGATGFTMYAETNVADEKLYIGRAPSIASGSKFTISIGYRDTKNPKYFFRFIITATMK